jgi:hypothetical protein
MKLAVCCIFWLSCILGNLAVLPYVSQLSNTPITLSLFLLACAQAIIVWGIIVFLGMLCATRANFKLIVMQGKHPLRTLLTSSIIGGILASSVLFILDTFVFTLPVTTIQADRMQGFLASFYGAINEEVFARFFLLSLFVLVFQTILPKYKRNHVIWGGIVFTSLIFGIGHLPALHKLIGFSIQGVMRVIMLNGFAGTIFGYLYWQYGLLSSMLAHFIADIILHVLVNS